MKRMTVMCLWGVTAMVTVAPLMSQTPAGPRELGMGGAYMGVARGYESIFLAPGNLGLPGTPKWSLGFPQVAIAGAVVGPNFSDMIDLIDFQSLEPTRQDEILGLIPVSGTEGRYAFRAPLAAYTYGGLGLGVGYAAVGRHTLSQDLTELLIRGYEEGRNSYDVGETYGERATYWDFAAAYGRSFGPLSIGATAHYIRGGNLYRTRLFEPVVDLEAKDVEVEYFGVQADGGTGYSVDFGAAYMPTARVTLSAAISNAFSNMTWTEELSYRTVTLDSGMIEHGSPQGIRNRYLFSESALDPESAPARASETAVGLYEDAQFPTVARFGLALQPYTRTRIAADVHRKLSEGRLGDSWDQRIAVGFQQSLPVGTVRGGYAVGNDGGNMIGAGISLGPMDLGVARYRDGGPDGTRAQGWMATFGLGMHQAF